MSDDHLIQSSLSPRRRSSAAVVTIAFAEGPEADRLLQEFARALARRVARQLSAEAPTARSTAEGVPAGDD